MKRVVQALQALLIITLGIVILILGPFYFLLIVEGGSLSYIIPCLEDDGEKQKRQTIEQVVNALHNRDPELFLKYVDLDNALQQFPEITEKQHRKEEIILDIKEGKYILDAQPPYPPFKFENWTVGGLVNTDITDFAQRPVANFANISRDVRKAEKLVFVPIRSRITGQDCSISLNLQEDDGILRVKSFNIVNVKNTQ